MGEIKGMNRKEMFEVADKIIDLLKKEKVTNSEADTITDIAKRKVLESIEYDKKDVYSNGMFNGGPPTI